MTLKRSSMAANPLEGPLQSELKVKACYLYLCEVYDSSALQFIEKSASFHDLGLVSHKLGET